MPAVVKPLDPDSEKGRAIAAELSQTLAEIFLELDAKKAAETAAGRKAA
jgi:hypothetical protein